MIDVPETKGMDQLVSESTIPNPGGIRTNLGNAYANPSGSSSSSISAFAHSGDQPIEVPLTQSAGTASVVYPACPEC